MDDYMSRVNRGIRFKASLEILKDNPEAAEAYRSHFKKVSSAARHRTSVKKNLSL